MPLYQPLIPSGTVDLDVDYQNIQDNFNQANVVYGTDHFPLDNATVGQQGFHDKATFPVRTDPTTIASQGIVYTKDSAYQPGRTDLYYAYQTAVGTPYTGTFFPLNFCKAFGRADAAGLVAGSSFNVANANLLGNIWTINLTSPASDNVNKMVVIFSPTSASIINPPSLDIVTTSQFTITRQNASATSISFMVMAI